LTIQASQAVLEFTLLGVDNRYQDARGEDRLCQFSAPGTPFLRLGGRCILCPRIDSRKNREAAATVCISGGYKS
jgi:hypothetical protein